MNHSPKEKIERLGGSVEALFAYASRMEREAVRRYQALTKIMAAHNNQELADLFRRFVDIEQKHVDSVESYARSLGMHEGAASAYPGAGLDGEEVMGFEEVHYLHRPHHAISIAHQFETRAAQLYTDIARATQSDEVRKVAEHFAADEQAHMKELERWLERYPKPEEDWEDDMDPPNESE